MLHLENSELCVLFFQKGAELRSIYDKLTERELLWQADPAYWAKSSPLLFPIVGALKGDEYIYEGKTYNLSRHGFARDNEFNIVYADNSQIIFELISDRTVRVSTLLIFH